MTQPTHPRYPRRMGESKLDLKPVTKHRYRKNHAAPNAVVYIAGGSYAPATHGIMAEVTCHSAYVYLRDPWGWATTTWEGLPNDLSIPWTQIKQIEWLA